MRFWTVLFVMLIWPPGLALAEPVVVTAGEHAGFTRVVFQFGAPVDWQLGRVKQGYGLRILPKAPDFDLKNVFDYIGKTRLTAANVDPVTGDLTLSLSCHCYAIPFELRPGVVVIDVRDGVAPTGSSFELPLQMPTAQEGQFASKQPLSTYDWTDLPLLAPMPGADIRIFEDLVAQPPVVDLAPLRLSLIEDLSRGASQGVVDMVVPGQTVQHPAQRKPAFGQIQIGPVSNVATRQTAAPNSPLTAQGGTCFADDQLDVAVWGGQQAIAAQIGPQRQGLMAEFDRPDADAAARAVRFQLFLGFGAEARSLIRSFAPRAPDAQLWTSMAHILDAEPDPASAFVGMEDCPTNAALWAMLSDGKALPVSQPAKAAVQRAFSALPPHLRRQLGPDLVDRYLGVNDLPAATALYDATLRAPGEDSPALALMQAKMDQALGKPEAAVANLSDLAKAPGPGSAEALVDLIETQARLGKPVTFAQVQTLAAYVTERRDGPDAPRFQQALVLARAASGDFDGAFADMAPLGDGAAIVWKLLATNAPNSAFLTHASLGSASLIPPRAEPVAVQIAERMLELGLSDQAGLWVRQTPHAPPELLARVKLAQSDAQAALGLLRGDESASAKQIKAQAYVALGQTKRAADLYADLGQTQDRWQALREAGDWQTLAAQGPDPWKAVATFALYPAPVPDTSAGPLARDSALVARSAAMREAILALLDQTKAPTAALH